MKKIKYLLLFFYVFLYSESAKPFEYYKKNFKHDIYETKKEDFNGDDESENIYFLATKVTDEENKTVTYQNGLIYYDSGDTDKNYVFYSGEKINFLNSGNEYFDYMVTGYYVGDFNNDGIRDIGIFLDWGEGYNVLVPVTFKNDMPKPISINLPKINIEKGENSVYNITVTDSFNNEKKFIYKGRKNSKKLGFTEDYLFSKKVKLFYLFGEEWEESCDCGIFEDAYISFDFVNDYGKVKFKFSDSGGMGEQLNSR
ncbi:hypothetical protein [Sebaldella sp. S0638]|uniref:hypothetical protein n=1 Tax=Sebaldella sp. S0638 TaxID=2957809 RepID=UPI00209DBE40|nr:hypothetical protein [Sebaldella sp. S0638]MCP1222797.1 hypothetical protein [Sebaldella sp. S0638]